MLTPKDNFPLPLSGILSSPGSGYAIRSTGTTRNTRLSLGLLPVLDGSKRTANVVAWPSHEVFKLKTGEAVASFLRSSFPQLSPLDNYFDFAELEKFATATPGVFPKPSYTKRSVAVLGGRDTYAALAGDAVHFFPPDLGQGVNSGLEDVFALSQALDRRGSEEELTSASLEQSLSEYQSERTVEGAFIAKIMTYGYPYQYSQSKWKGRFALLNFAMRLGLNKVAPFLFHPPAFFMVQSEKMFSYSTIDKLAQRTTRAIVKTALAIAALVVYRGWIWSKAAAMAKAARGLLL